MVPLKNQFTIEMEFAGASSFDRLELAVSALTLK